MRIVSSQPGQQLRSVALRYRLPRALGGKEALPGGPALIRFDTGHRVAAVAPVVLDSRLARDADLARLEAVLLLAREPLTSRKLSQYANLADGTRARTLVRRLNEQYDAAGRAFRVEQVASGYQLLTRRKFGPWLRRLSHVPAETRLSGPGLETLAVIAYRQPVPRADIEAIRGVNCGEILRQLMDRDLVRIGGRGDELGRPYLYSTTKRFLQIFGLVGLDDLPQASVLRDAPLPADTPPVALFVSAQASEPDEAEADERDDSDLIDSDLIDGDLIDGDLIDGDLTDGDFDEANPESNDE